MPVRAAAAQCLQSLAFHWSALYTTELDSVCQAIFRGFDGANAQTRKSLSQLLGCLIGKITIIIIGCSKCKLQISFKTITAYTQQPPTTSLPSSGSKSGVKAVRPGTIKAGTLTLEDAMNVLLHGYVKGGSGGSGKCQSTIAPITVKSKGKSSKSFSVKMTTRFAILFIGTILKYFMFDFGFVGLMITKTGGSIGPDVRVGVALSYIAMATKLGGKWLERNLSTFLHHVISGLLSHPKAVTNHADTVQSRRCVGSIVRLTIGKS